MTKNMMMTAAAVFLMTSAVPAFSQETMSTEAEPTTISASATTGVDCPFGTAPSIDNCGFAAADTVKAIGDTASAKVREIKEQIKAKTELDVEDVRQAHLDTERDLLEFQATYKVWLGSVKGEVRGAVVADIKKANSAASGAVDALRSQAYKAVKIVNN